jgi:hypothetical protein
MGITVSVSGLIINDNTDSYPGGSTIDGQTLVNNFRSHWNTTHSNISRDGAILFAYRDLTRVINGNITSIGGQVYAPYRYLCNTANAYAIIGNNNQNFYYSWITAHELGHLAGHDSHDNSTPNIMVGAPNTNPIPNSNFTAASRNIILTKFENTFDEQCIVNGDIKLKRYSSYLYPYNVNQVCVFNWSNLTAPGNHNITWTFASNNTGANYSNTTATSTTLYHGNNTGTFTLKLSKTNECGNVDRFYPFQVNNCASYTYYPNETAKYLNVEFTETKYSNLPDEIYVVNESGKKVLSELPKENATYKSLNEKDVNHKFVFNLTDKPNGIYFLKVYFKIEKLTILKLTES